MTEANVEGLKLALRLKAANGRPVTEDHLKRVPLMTYGRYTRSINNILVNSQQITCTCSLLF